MSKKIEKKDVEEEKTEEDTEEETEEETEKEEEELEKAADALAQKVEQKISAKLNLKELREKISTITSGSLRSGRDYSMASKIFAEGDVKKNVDALTKEEKIVGFFQALVNDDHVAMKALSEGVEAEGGYLFPDYELVPCQ